MEEGNTWKKNTNWDYISLERSRNNWRSVAVIFIILFLIGAFLFLYLVKLGTEVITEEEIFYNNKMDCSNNICPDKNADAFIYEDNMCYCYKGGNVIYKKFLK